jgi:PD-(D/E)XK nuclease superfamily
MESAGHIQASPKDSESPPQLSPSSLTGKPGAKRPHVSPSQLMMMERCGQQYFYRYVQGLRLPPGVAAIRGTAVHKGAEMNYHQKMTTHVDLKPSEVVEIAAAAFDEKVKTDGVFLNDEERAAGESKIVGAAKDTTVSLAHLMAVESLPKFQPSEVEVTQEILIPESSHDLLGRIDLIDEREIIVDFKTSGKTKLQSDIDSDAQFTFYSLTYRAAKGKDPRGTIIENLVSTKVPKAVSFSTSRTADDYQVLINRINRMLGALKAGIFMPAAPGSWACSAKFCGYHHMCPLINNKRVIGGVS